MKKIIYSFIIVVISSCCEIAAQNTTFYDVKEYGRNELSSNLINKIAQDSEGFIWIATHYGLNKFDGTRFTQYLHNEDDKTSLLNNNVRTMLVDNDGTLWIGTSTGLQYYKPDEDSFETISFIGTNKTPHISDIMQFNNNELWIATSGAGIYTIDKEARLAIYQQEITSLTGNFTDHIFEDRRHNIWIAVRNRGLMCFAPNKSISIYGSPDIPSNVLNEILEDEAGTLFISTPTAICYFDSIENKFVQIENENEGIRIREIIVSKDNVIYAGTDGQGLHYVDRQNNELRPVSNRRNPQYNNARIHFLIEDRDRNIWLGCYLKGLIMFSNESTQFDYWDIVNSELRLNNILSSVICDSQGDIWCGTDRNGLFQLNANGKIIKHYIEGREISQVFEDSNNNLWISSASNGLGLMDRNAGKCTFTNIPLKGYIKVIAEGLDKNLYLSTFGFGFIRYNHTTKKWKKYDMTQTHTNGTKLDNDWINSILCDSKGLIWLGHYSGINCYDPKTDEFLKIENVDVIAKQVCISLMESHDGNIWIGTYNGLYCINRVTNGIKNYTVSDGLSNNVICGIAQDKDGNIWCSTFNGINQLDLKEDRFINYYTGNGLIDKIYTRGICFQDKNNKIYFGGSSGITSFYPQNITTPSYNNKVLITGLYIHNQSVNTNTISGKKHTINSELLNADNFRFSYEDNTFTFEFSTMDFRDVENINYEYRIKELSLNWNSTSPGISQVTYNHLPFGKYTFEVRACKYGTYSPVKQMLLMISPPWYRSTIAYIVYLCLLLLITTLIFNLIRKKRNEEIKESKLQYFINISHEIRSPLTLIISPLEKLLKGNYDPATMKTLYGMQRNANRIIGLVNQLLDIRKFDKGQMKLKFSEVNIIGFIEELFDVFEYQASKRNIRFIFEHQMNELSVWLDQNNFDKILMNLLSNAFKYTPDHGEIIITLSTGIDNENWGPLHNYIEISIADNGIGLDEDKIDKIFERFYQIQNQESFTTIGSGIGLNLTRILVLLHHGTISARNRKDNMGSCFTVRIPLGKDHLRKDEIIENSSHARPILQQGNYIHIFEDKKNTIKRKTNYKILIIDDEEEIRDYLIQELEGTYKVFTATDGIEGFQVAINQLPDVIISDVMMPNMDGISFVKKLKSNSNVSYIPVILLTSKTEQEDRIEGLAKGADVYMAKPFSMDELLITINSLIVNRGILKGKYSGAQDQKDKVKPIVVKSNDEILLEKIVTIINNNLSNSELDINMLGAGVGISRVQLHRKMKELTSLSPGDFIRNIRLKQAAILLKEKKMDISQVAYAVGFSNRTYFSTAFKKFYGVSPKDYITKI